MLHVLPADLPVQFYAEEEKCTEYTFSSHFPHRFVDGVVRDKLLTDPRVTKFTGLRACFACAIFAGAQHRVSY